MPWLQWYQRDENFKATAQTPYRLLQPVQALSHGAEDAPNMLIQGDNLQALKALLPYCAGQVKCIFIDPPYNTKNAFEHYDDNLEHVQWLSMMYGASTPPLKTGVARCGGGVLARRCRVDMARVSGRAGEVFGWGCRVGPISFLSGSAQGVLVLL